MSGLKFNKELLLAKMAEDEAAGIEEPAGIMAISPEMLAASEKALAEGKPFYPMLFLNGEPQPGEEPESEHDDA